MLLKDDVATSFILELFQATGVPPEWIDTICGERTAVMLSKDDLMNGTTFILKLTDAAGAPAQWVASLRGKVALYWYEVYRRSDWTALRAHGGEVFHDRVTEAQAEHVRRSGRCIVIHTPQVKAEEIDPPNPQTKPLQPDWENDGGSLAPIAMRSAGLALTDNPTDQDVGNTRMNT